MAAIFIPKSARVALTLAAGTDPVSGRALTKTTSYSGVATNAEATPIKAVADLTAPCLAHPISVITYTLSRTVEDE